MSITSTLDIVLQIKHEGFGTMRVFFNWYYWCVNAGALIALGGLAYVQQEVSFFWGYVAPCIALCVALIVFVSGNSFSPGASEKA